MEAWRRESSGFMRVLGFLGYIPFVFFMVFSLLGYFDLDVTSGFISALILIRIISKYGKIKTIEIVALIFFASCEIVLIFSQEYSEILRRYVSALLYAALFAMALLSLLMKNPFTLQHAKEGVIEEVWNTQEFIYVNYLLTWIFTVVFLSNTLINIKWNEGFFPATPISIILLFIALISTRLLPKYVVIYHSRKHRISHVNQKEITVREIFEGMSKAFNPEKAMSLNAIIQCNISGNGGGKWFIRIKDKKCTISEGEVQDPSTKIFSDAKTWIGICTGRLKGSEAFMTGNLRVEGDFNDLLKLDEIFEKFS
ncbi:MAG: SCP2 sterol-binding domain-containing protein [Candidatus Methanofastidiosia archaeon]